MAASPDRGASRRAHGLLFAIALCLRLRRGDAFEWGTVDAWGAQPLSVSSAHGCAIRVDTNLPSCFRYSGEDSPGEPPAVPMASIAAGSVINVKEGQAQAHTCGVRLDDRRAQCWGDNSAGQSSPPADVAFLSLTAGCRLTCGIRFDNRNVVCWGDNDWRQASPPPGVAFKAISAFSYHVCGIVEEDSTVRCWGWAEHGQLDPPLGVRFLEVAAGDWFTCGITEEHRLLCWGSLYNEFPDGLFHSVSAGTAHACARNLVNGTTVCWHFNGSGQVSDVPPLTQLTSLSLSYFMSCGLRIGGGQVVCWGYTNGVDSLAGEVFQTTPCTEGVQCPPGLRLRDFASSVAGNTAAACCVEETSLATSTETPELAPFDDGQGSLKESAPSADVPDSIPELAPSDSVREDTPELEPHDDPSAALMVWSAVGIGALAAAVTAGIAWRRRAIRKSDKRARGVPPLGVSVAYLLDVFPGEARSATGKSNPNFNEICPELAFGPRGKGYDKRCPRDDMPGCSIVDALDDNQRGPATHFVSWCWGYSLEVFVEAVDLWARRENIDQQKTFLWVCFFCNNQYRLLKEGEHSAPKDLQQIFGQTLQTIGKMLIIFNCFQEPEYINRAWCLFECFSSLREKIPVQVILPKSAEASFRHAIGTGLVLTRLPDKFRGIDVRNASASRAEDEVAIKSLISSSVGFDAVNDLVKKKLKEWVVGEFERFLDSSS